jgi:hypothetical protein
MTCQFSVLRPLDIKDCDSTVCRTLNLAHSANYTSSHPNPVKNCSGIEIRGGVSRLTTKSHPHRPHNFELPLHQYEDKTMSISVGSSSHDSLIGTRERVSFRVQRDVSLRAPVRQSSFNSRSNFRRWTEPCSYASKSPPRSPRRATDDCAPRLPLRSSDSRGRVVETRAQISHKAQLMMTKPTITSFLGIETLPFATTRSARTA